jgi:hypothetical protein
VSWVPVIAWIGVAVLALVTLAFCAYEVTWKARRLQRDLGALVALGGRAQQLQAEVAAIQQRLERLSG